MDEERNPEVPERKNRRPIIVGVAIVAVAALAIGGVYGYRAYEGHKMSVARQACRSAVADQSKVVKAYKALLGADGTVAALKTDAKSVKDARTVDTLAKAAKERGIDLETAADAYGNHVDMLPDFDLVVLAPQAASYLADLQKDCERVGNKCVACRGKQYIELSQNGDKSLAFVSEQLSK